MGRIFTNKKDEKVGPRISRMARMRERSLRLYPWLLLLIREDSSHSCRFVISPDLPHSNDWADHFARSPLDRRISVDSYCGGVILTARLPENRRRRRAAA